MRWTLVLLLALVPGASAQSFLVLTVEPVAPAVSGNVTFSGVVEVPDGAVTNVWVEVSGLDAQLGASQGVRRLEGAPVEGVGGRTHTWATAWDSSAAPDGSREVRFLARSGDGRASNETVLRFDARNGNWATLVGGNATITDEGVGIALVNVTFVVASGFQPSAATVSGIPAPSQEPLALSSLPLADGTYRTTVAGTWRVLRPAPGDEPMHAVAQVTLQRGAALGLLVPAAGEGVPFDVVAREDAVAAGDGPPGPWRTPAGPVDPYGPVDVAIAGGALLTVAAGVAVASTEVGRYAAMGLFSRLRGPKVLEHPTRSRLEQLIQQHPGVRLKTLRGLARVPLGLLTHHLQVLEREGLVRRVRDGGRVLFFAAAAAPGGFELHPQAFRLWGEVARSPHRPLADIAQAWGVPRQSVHHHARRLRGLGLLSADAPWVVRPLPGSAPCRACHWVGPLDAGTCARCGGSA